MSDVYFIQVRCDALSEVAEAIKEQADEENIEDNIIIVPSKVRPLDRGEAVQYLEEMANALDFEVTDESD